MNTLIVIRRWNSNLIGLPKIAQTIGLSEIPERWKCRSKRWNLLKNNASYQHMTPRVERIQVEYLGLPNCALSMSKSISTPFDCAKHLSQMLCDRSVLALVDGVPFDMHRPLTRACTLDFLHFKDIHHDPSPVNEAFWRSCQLLLAVTLECSFKKEFDVRLLHFPVTSLDSGSFVADISIKVPENYPEFVEWLPSELDLKELSMTGQKIANRAYNFEVHQCTIHEAEIAIDDLQLSPMLFQEASDLKITTIPLYKIGECVQAHTTVPMIASTRFVGRFSVTAMYCLGRLSEAGLKHTNTGNILVYRVQGIAVPTAFLTHFTTFDILRRRAGLANAELSRTPDYIEPI